MGGAIAMKIIIIGGGIAGLSTAIALQKAGLKPLVFERAPELREVGAGISLWANALRALDHLGVGDAVRDVAQSPSAAEIRRDNGKRLLRVDYAHFENRDNLPKTLWMLHRADLIHTLARFLPRNCLHLDKEFIGLEQDSTQVTVRFADGTTEKADAILGADGIHSKVSEALFGKEPTRYSGSTCWRGIATIAPGIHPHDLLVETWGIGKRFGITPLSGNRIYWFAVSQEPANGVDQNGKVEVKMRFENWAAPVPEILENTPEDSIIRNDIIDRPPHRHWSRGRVLLVGDAAHSTTPNLGQGGCMAIEDAPVLARCLVEADSLTTAFATFENLRYQRTAQVTNTSWRMGYFAQGATWPVRVARDWITWLTPPAIAFKQFTGLTSYDTGPIHHL